MGRNGTNDTPTGATVGPLVVAGQQWGTPQGLRGQLAGLTVAEQAAVIGAPVALVLGDPAAVPLWPASLTPTPTGQYGQAEPWRYRLTVPLAVGGDRVVTLVIVARDVERRAGPFAAFGGSDLCAALAVAERVLGVPWGHSTSRTVEHLILSTHPVRRGGRRLDRSPQVPAVAGDAERAYYWRRELTEWEATAPYVHTYDANAAYLGAIQSLDLGFGRPEHYSTPRGCLPRLSMPGLWRVDVPESFGADDGLPPIMFGRAGDDAGRWVSTPTLHRLSEYSEARGLGAITPEEGHVWPERARWLNAAAVRLRDARTGALTELPRAAQQLAAVAASARATDAEVQAAVHRYVAAGFVTEAVKALYTVLPGRFASQADYVAEGWRRPDWAAAIIATFRVNLHRKLQRLAGPPFAIGTDALAFASDDPDPARYAAAIGLRLGDGLGQFQVQGSGRADSPDLAEAIARGRGGVRALFDAAKRARRADPSPAGAGR